jgi:hypothetical protein
VLFCVGTELGWEHAIAEWLRHYATSRNVAFTRPGEVSDFFFSLYIILPAGLGPGVDSASNTNEYQKQRNVCGE